MENNGEFSVIQKQKQAINTQGNEDERLPLEVSLDDILEKVDNPLVKKMKGFDQRTEYHDLTLDEHTKEMVKKLEACLERYGEINLSEREKQLILLAGKFHDIGKLSPEGQKENPKDSTKMQYPNHEKVSAKVAHEILAKYFDLSEAELVFVESFIGLHASAINVANNFSKNDQPKGSELGSYADFVEKVDGIPSRLSLAEKMKIVLAITESDISACVGPNSDPESEKVKKITSTIETGTSSLGKLRLALPALLDAVAAKKSGKDMAAGIVFEDGRYIYKPSEQAAKKKSESIEMPKEIHELELDEKIIKILTQRWAILKSKKADADDVALEGMLKKQLGIKDETYQKILELL